ncbi:ATP-grasp domain-containing protein [Candidatus Woesearchaeota archaeon]|nr:ATP-grasp domain-containing protein [Candidatus Woesearchaeota archaeon]
MTLRIANIERRENCKSKIVQDLEKTAEYLGHQIDSIPSAQLLDGTQRLTNQDIVLIYGSIITNARYSEIAQAVQNQGLTVFDKTENMQQVHSMEKYYDILREQGIPTPKTAIIPLPAEIVKYAKTGDVMSFILGLEDVLTAKLPEELTPSKENRIFLKTDKRSSKIKLNRNFAKDMCALQSKAYYMIRDSRQDVGSLVIREDAKLQLAYIGKSDGVKRKRKREYRFFVIGGEPICWSFYNEINNPRQETIEKCKLQPDELEQMKNILNKITPAIKSHFYVADFGVKENGDSTIIELNPGYASGIAYDCFPVVHSALFSYLSLVKKDPKMLCNIPDGRFKEQLDFEQLEKVRKDMTGDSKKWGIFSGWLPK